MACEPAPASAGVCGSDFREAGGVRDGFGRRHLRRAGHEARASMAESICAMTGLFGVALGKETRMRVLSASMRAAILSRVSDV